MTIGQGQSSGTLPVGCVYVLRAYIPWEESPEWREHGGSLIVVGLTGAATTVTVEYLGGWDALGSGDAGVTPLADWQADVVVFYAVSRCFRQLASNRSDFRRYATVMNNQVNLEDIERLAATWQEDFEVARLEARTRRQLLYDAQRVSGSKPEGE